MSLREAAPALWGWTSDPDLATTASTAAANAAPVGGADLIVVGVDDDDRPRLDAHVFLTESGRRALGEEVDHLGALAPLDCWFRAEAAGLEIVHVVDDVATAPPLDTTNRAIEVTELVHRHLGYLPVRWAMAAASIDGTRSVRDYLQAYNYSRIARDHLATAAAAAADGHDHDAEHTRQVCEQLALGEPSHCHRTATRDEIALEDYVPRKVGPQFWAFDRQWYRDQRARWHRFIESERTDDRPFVIAGNGPSLRNSIDPLRTNRHRLRLVTSNFAALEPDIEASTHVHTVVNYLVAEQAAGLFNLLPERIAIVVPFWLSYCIRPRPNVYFTETTADLRFSTDIAREISWVHTVSFYALQMAGGLSTADVGLVGFDHSYVQPEEVDEGDELVDPGPDQNHFRADYFSGKRWQAADTDMMETVYRLADEAYRSQDRRVVNCTVGGSLEVFPRSTLRDFLER